MKKMETKYNIQRTLKAPKLRIVKPLSELMTYEAQQDASKILEVNKAALQTLASSQNDQISDVLELVRSFLEEPY